MQNENVENQPNQIRRNPSRDNTNVNQGQSNEKRFNEDNSENRSLEIYSAEGDSSNADVESGGVSDSDSDSSRQFSGGEATLERGFSSGQSSEQSSGQQGQQEQQQAQQQQPDGVKGDPEKSGAGAGYGQSAGTNTTGQDDQSLMGEDNDQNRTSGTAPGSGIGNLQNSNRGGQQSGQFNQSQDDSRRQ